MNIELILAGGTGMRLGSDIPKQYIQVKWLFPIALKYSARIRRLTQYRSLRIRSGKTRYKNRCQRKL